MRTEGACADRQSIAWASSGVAGMSAAMRTTSPSAFTPTCSSPKSQPCATGLHMPLSPAIRPAASAEASAAGSTISWRSGTA